MKLTEIQQKENMSNSRNNSGREIEEEQRKNGVQLYMNK